MTEENDDDIWADNDAEAESEEDSWISNDPFFGGEGGSTWEDSQGVMHEVRYDEPDDDQMERRVGFDTFEEARDYIDEILTTADQYFDIFFDNEMETYEVYYMGGSE